MGKIMYFVVIRVPKEKKRKKEREREAFYLDYLWQRMNGRTGGSLGKQNLSTLRFTLCHCCQCLCNAGQKSIMSKLISCTRKLNRSRLKREEKIVNIALWKMDSDPDLRWVMSSRETWLACCLDNIQVVHCVCTVLISVGENEHGKIQNIIYDRRLSYGQYCKTFM